jgi:hypothetical protein
MKISLALALLIPTSVFAAGPLDGTWKTDLASATVKNKATVYKLKDGMFTCSSCNPSYTVKADGTDQPVKGRSYVDTIAVTVTDPSNITLNGKLAGKPAFTSAMSVSADGNTLTSNFNQMNVGSEAVTGTQVGTRKGKASKGDSPITGKWEFTTPAKGLPDAALLVTYTTSADGVQMKWNGQTYDAKFDGKQVPLSNDPGNTMVSIKKVSDHEIIETDYRMGKKVEVMDTKISADGKSGKVVDKNLRNDSVTTYTINKQS